MISIEVKRVHRIKNPKGKARGYVDVLLGGLILFKGCRIVEGADGLFASLLQTQNPTNKKWYPVAIIGDAVFYNAIMEAMLKAFIEEEGEASLTGETESVLSFQNGNQ